MTETVVGERPAEAGPAVPGLAPAPVPAIAVVGAGRAGSALAVALDRAGYPVRAICSRDAHRAAALALRVGAPIVATPLAAARVADITLLTVPDGAITGVAASMAATGAALTGRGVVHCSASRGAEAVAALRLTGAAVGALHPLQALAGEESSALLRGSLMALEADPPLLGPLERLATDLGGRPVALPPGSRTLYHAAAVLVASGPVALLAVAAELLAAAGLASGDAEAGLTALMEGAIANVRRAGAREALTGPVQRNDAATLAQHLRALGHDPETAALYRALARATLRLAGVDGREGIARLLEENPPCP